MSWTRFDIFYEGDPYYDQLIQAINGAQDEILFEVYIFSLDALGKIILDALIAAAQRGVRVRLCIDGIGSFYYLEVISDLCEKHKIEFKAYHAFPIKARYSSLFIEGKLWTQLLRFFSHINKRNHRKLIVIDQKVAFVGSRNITQVHSEKISGKNAFRDTSAIVEGLDLPLLRDAFLSTWGDKPVNFTKRGLRSGNILLNSKLRLRRKLVRSLLLRIKTAQRRIWITNAYFVPHRTLTRALKKASKKRNVEVCLLLPSKTDLPLFLMLSRSFYAGLLKSGVKLYEYDRSVLHAKTTLIDDWASLGSFNFNHRSLIHDLELEILSDRPEVVSSFEAQWAKDLTFSHPQDRREILNRSRLERACAWILYQLRYWL